jgi:hypothetical protein
MQLSWVAADMVWRFCRVGVVLLGLAALGRAQTSPAPLPVPGSSPTLLPPCAQIAASGPRFAPLAQACQYALSPDRLPDFVCEEEIQQSTRFPGYENWTYLDVMTQQVSFEQGNGTQYAKVTIDGHRIRQLAGWHSSSDYWKYLAHNHLGGMVDLGQFISDLRIVFTPQNHTSFDYKNEITVRNRPLEVFGFQIKKPSADTKWRNFLPGLTFGEDGVYTGLTGLLWVDKRTSSLRRIVTHSTEIDPKDPVEAESSATDYGSVTIPGLGQFLLPKGGEQLACLKSGRCWRNVVTFKNCHKFAGKSRILPAE